MTARSCCLCTVRLDGGRGIPGGCWWVVRVAAEVFDELLCVLARSSSGLKDERNQVDAGVPVKLFLLFAFSNTKPGRELAAENSPALEEKWRDHCRVDVVL